MGNVGTFPSFQTEEDQADMYNTLTNDIRLPDAMNDGERRSLKKGDLIQFQRGKYEHWAVYLGENLAVSNSFLKILFLLLYFSTNRT
jgi:cell wall-associated NlpC family hydrolase